MTVPDRMSGNIWKVFMNTDRLLVNLASFTVVFSGDIFKKKALKMTS